MTTESLSVTIEGEVLTVEIGTVAAPAGGGGSSDHGTLTGLADDDHTQYALADGSRGTFATAAQGALADTAVQPAAIATKLDDISAGTADAIVTASADGTLLSRAAYTIAGLLAAAYARASHTGTQLASTISDFASAAISAVTWSTITGKPSTFPPEAHNQDAGTITTGTLAHERGGLEADVSAYSGLVKIAAGATSAVTVTAAGEALLDDADASAQRATLGLVIGTNVQAYDADLTTWAGVTPGTGIATALAVNVGTAGAPVINGGALGTPSSGTLTNCTGLPPAALTQSGASSSDVLAWNGSAWVPTAPSGGGSSNTKWVGAGELIPRVTNGAGIDGEELATNDINLDYLAFDAATSEGAQVSFAWPGAYTTFTATFHWTAASGSGTVTWTAAARCYADDDALDQAQGTAQSVTDTLLAANDAHKSSATSAVTPGGTVAAGNLTVVQVTRDIADTLAVDARLIGVLLEFS